MSARVSHAKVGWTRAEAQGDSLVFDHRVAMHNMIKTKAKNVGRGVLKSRTWSVGCAEVFVQGRRESIGRDVGRYPKSFLFVPHGHGPASVKQARMFTDTQNLGDQPFTRTDQAQQPVVVGRRRLLVVLAVLYCGQAVPAYLVGTAAVSIMREQSVSRSAIGLVGLLLLPMLFRFLWAPYVDRIRPFARAHRAGWIGLTQSAIITFLVALSFVQPSSIGVFLCIGMAITTLIATNDIAVDGYATQYLSSADRPLANAIQGASVSFGLIVGGSGGLLAYHFWGWQVAVLIVAVLSFVPLLAVVMMQEGGGCASPRHDANISLRAFFQRPEAVRALGVALTYRASEGLMNAMTAPYLIDKGIELDTIGYLTGVAAAVAGIAGSVAAALLVTRLGAAKALGLLGLLRTSCYLWFTLHSLDVVSGDAGLLAAEGGKILVRVMDTVSVFTVFMMVSSGKQPGTDYSILSCAQVLIYLIGWASAGLIADYLGYSSLFVVATIISLGSILMSVWLLKGVGQRG